MPINSRQKGKAGELEWAHYLTDRGYPARRGQQFSGRDDSPDVVCESLRCLHFEVKRVQSLNIKKAYLQSMRDARDKIPMVTHRRNGEEWLITLSADQFFDFFIPGYILLHQPQEEKPKLSQS